MSEKSYFSVVEDTKDGSGDVIITIPDEILEQMGWSEGTELDIDTETVDGQVVLVLKLSQNHNKPIDKA